MASENPIKFDYNKLTKDDKALYCMMSESDKKAFETMWCNIELKKAQFKAKKRKLRSDINNEKRKARTHFLCQLGGIVDKYIDDTENFNLEAFDEYMRNFKGPMNQKCSKRQNSTPQNNPPRFMNDMKKDSLD